MTTNPMTRLLALALLLAASGTQADPAKPAIAPVLSSSETILGQPFAYPAASPHVTAVIVTLPPGARTGWHRHPVPLFGYMLEGELTVAYEGAGERIYRPGLGVFLEFEWPSSLAIPTFRSAGRLIC